MMKTVILIRHIKSSWEDATLADYDRPLRPDRQRDAAIIARELAKRRVKPHYVLCSPAQRTRDTATLLCSYWSIDIQAVKMIPTLYECTANTILSCIDGTPSDIDTLTIIGHNPSLTDTLNTFIKTPILNLPTAGCAILSFDCTDWAGVERGILDKSILIRPKDYR
jgi:phosphohistidine phosphatase